MSTEPEAIRRQLNALGIFDMKPDAQVAIADRLAAAGISVIDLANLYRYSESKTSTPKMAVGSLTNLLKMDTDLIREKVREAGSMPPTKSFGDPADVLRTTSSSTKFVSRTNPYGWSDADRVRGSDHGEPGVWNAFRQCYNLSVKEMPREKVNDARRGGCSRYEVLGSRGRTVPKTKWDEDEANRIKAFAPFSEPIVGGEVFSE